MSGMQWRPRPPKASVPRRGRRVAPVAPQPVPRTVQLQGELSRSAERHLQQRSPEELARPRGGMGGVTLLLLCFVIGIAVVIGLAATGNL